MFIFRNHTISIMVLFAVALHLLWAVLIEVDHAALGATGVSALYLYIGAPRMLAFVDRMLAFVDAVLGAVGLGALHLSIGAPQLLAVVIACVALLALLGIFTRRPWIVVALLLPQQALLMMSAAGVIEAIWLAQFADGVFRPRAFIAADQMYSVLAAIGHTVAITAHAVARISR